MMVTSTPCTIWGEWFVSANTGSVSDIQCLALIFLRMRMSGKRLVNLSLDINFILKISFLSSLLEFYFLEVSLLFIWAWAFWITPLQYSLSRERESREFWVLGYVRYLHADECGLWYSGWNSCPRALLEDKSSNQSTRVVDREWAARRHEARGLVLSSRAERADPTNNLS